MRKQFRHVTLLALITFLTSLGTVVTAQVRAYQVTDRQVQTVLDRIENRTNSFKTEVDRALDGSPVNNTTREDSINQMVANFETATNTLRNNFSARRSTASDVQDLLDRAVFVNTFMQNNRSTPFAQTQWGHIRTDLDTLASYYRVRTNWNASATWPGAQSGYYTSGTQLRTLLDRLRLRSDAFRASFDRWSNNNRRNTSWSVDNISQHVSEFQRELHDLDRNYGNRGNAQANVEQVLRPAAAINSFVASNPTNRDITGRWNLVRSDLNTLAGYYRVAWNWNTTTFPSDTFGGFDARLTGTYGLNTSLSDNITTVVDRAIIAANYNVDQQDRIRRNLERRMLSPKMLSLEKRGQQITMSSPNGSQVSITADGINRSEISPNGRTVRTSVTATNRDLTINYEGDRMNDYFVTFTPAGNDRLRVTRRVYLENETVTVTSVYDKTSPTPDWNLAGYPSNTGGSTTAAFVIPNNTAIMATLDTPLSTKTAKDGDRFTMTVTSPGQYRGAVIEGNVFGERSGVFSGRANMSLSFDTIRLRNGQTYKFAGIVEQVRHPDGDIVSVNNEGAVRDSSQTSKTVTRAGVGGLLGAIIGAIAGGGKGAAIGAAVGAGAGAGTVVLQGRDNLELQGGTQFNITATSPSSTVGIR